MCSLKTAITCVQWGAKVVRWAGGQRLVASIRHAGALGILAPLHYRVLHAARNLAVEMAGHPPEKAQERASFAARQFCTECRDVMGRMLEVEPSELHCCLKVMTSQEGQGHADRVATWARSDPLDDRPVEIGNQNAHVICKNSVWASLMGESDGRLDWRPFPCFACNDLANAKGFRCDRDNWEDYYRSALVYPLRYIASDNCYDYVNFGFLAFDSPRNGVFLGVPEIYDYKDEPPRFRARLEKSAVFNLGAIIADALSMFMRPYYEGSLRQGKEIENGGRD